jgi:hypothetical protein
MSKYPTGYIQDDDAKKCFVLKLRCLESLCKNVDPYQPLFMVAVFSYMHKMILADSMA